MTSEASHTKSDPIRFLTHFSGGPNHDRIGFRYWKDPGPFVQFRGIAGAKGRFLGFWAVLTQAAFSFIGTEIVAVSTCRFLYGRLQFHCRLYTRSLPLKLKILGAISQRPSKEYTFVGSPSYYTEYVFVNLTPRYSSLLHRWYPHYRSFGSVQSS